MNRYKWAKLFIRMQRALALIIALFGMLSIAAVCLIALTTWQQEAYTPSAGLSSAVESLGETLLETRGTVNDFMAKFPSGSVLTNLTLTAEDFRVSCSSKADFDALDHLLIKARKEVDLTKENLLASVESQITELHRQLMAHAASVVAGQTNAPGAAAANTKGAGSGPAEAAPGLPQAGQGVAGQKPVGLFEITEEESRDRQTVLENVGEFLSALGAMSERAENKDRLRKVTEDLEVLKTLLDYKAKRGEDRQVTQGASMSVNQTPGPSSDPKPREPLAAELAARKLAGALGAVQEALLTKWTVDERLSAAVQSASEQRVSSEKCWSSQLTTLLTGGMQALVALITAAGLAFLILVLADFLQAQIDTADATTSVALIYQQGQIEVTVQPENAET